MVVALAAVVYWGASAFPVLDSGLGAGGFPKFIAVCLGVLGTVLAVTSYVRLRKCRDQEKQVLRKGDLLGAAVLASAFYLYIVLVKPLGYVLATTIFFFLFMLIYGERKWLRMAVISVGFSVAAYLLFRNVFYIMLPKGILF